MPRPLSLVRRHSYSAVVEKEEMRVPRPKTISRQPREMSQQRTSSRDFEPVRLLGKGSFGAVLLVRKRTGTFSGDLFALKVMKKKTLVSRGAVQVARVEREVLAVIRHPYLVKLCYSFQSKTRLYLVTEYFEGGALDARLKSCGRLGDSPATQTLAAQLSLAIEHLHSRGVIHRDIKAANVLFDATGNAHLADFGLAAYLDDASRRTSFCGTLDYMAPELFLKKNAKGYTTAVDFWSLGIVIYEAIRGQTPFKSKKPRQLFENILRADADFQGLDTNHRPLFSRDARRCVASLLLRDTTNRADITRLRSEPFLASRIREIEKQILLRTSQTKMPTYRSQSESQLHLPLSRESFPEPYFSPTNRGRRLERGAVPNDRTTKIIPLHSWREEESRHKDTPARFSENDEASQDDSLDIKIQIEKNKVAPPDDKVRDYMSPPCSPVSTKRGLRRSSSEDEHDGPRFRPDAFAGFSFCQDDFLPTPSDADTSQNTDFTSDDNSLPPSLRSCEDTRPDGSTTKFSRISSHKFSICLGSHLGLTSPLSKHSDASTTSSTPRQEDTTKQKRIVSFSFFRTNSAKRLICNITSSDKSSRKSSPPAAFLNTMSLAPIPSAVPENFAQD